MNADIEERGAGIGVEQLPVPIRESKILTQDDLVRLAAVNEIPRIEPSFTDDTLKNIFQYYSINPDEMETEVHIYAKKLLDENKLAEAWQVLLATS